MKISFITMVKGVAWTVGFWGLSQALRIVSSVILTRLSTPEIFGILVIVYVLRNGIDLLSDVGFSQSLVISKNADEPEFYNTVWSLRLIRSLLLLPFCIAAAVPFADVYHAPMLGWILPVVGVYFVLGGLTSLSLIFLQKRLATAKFNLFQFIIEATTTISQIIFAYFSPTVWAVVFGGFISAVASTIGSYLIMPDLRHKFYISKEYARYVFTFGKWIFVSSAIFFVAVSFDNLYFGRVVPLELLGVYGVARNIAESATGLVVRVNSIVTFPFVAKHSEWSRAHFRKQFGSVRARFMIVAAFGFSILVAAADLLIRALYDHRYQSAGWMLSLMLIGRWFAMICLINDSTLIGFGKPIYSPFSFGLKFGMLLIGLPLVFLKYGIVGALIYVAITEIFRYVPILIGQMREGFAFVTQDLAMTLLMFLLVGLWQWLRLVFGLDTTFGSMLSFG